MSVYSNFEPNPYRKGNHLMTDQYTRAAQISGIPRAAVKRVALALGYSAPPPARTAASTDPF